MSPEPLEAWFVRADGSREPIRGATFETPPGKHRCRAVVPPRVQGVACATCGASCRVRRNAYDGSAMADSSGRLLVAPCSRCSRRAPPREQLERGVGRVAIAAAVSVFDWFLEGDAEPESLE